MGISLFGGMGDAMFRVVPVIVTIGFIVVMGMLIAMLVQGAGQWKRNNASPVLTVDARVITKRMGVSSRHRSAGVSPMHHNSHTSYYVTFEVQSGDRIEFAVSGPEYGQLAEQDFGALTFQGTRYLGFERSRNQ